MASWVTHLMIADRVLEEYLFLMGYYSHLITDAEFQRFIRGEQRVASVWERIKEHLYYRKDGRACRKTGIL